MRGRRLCVSAAVVIVAALLAILGFAVPDSLASPTTATGFGFHSFEASLSGTQAGSHPNLTVAFSLNDAVNQHMILAPIGGEVRNLAVNLPPGLVGNATTIPKCTGEEFESKPTNCPGGSKVGYAIAYVGGQGGVPGGSTTVGPEPVFNMVPPPGVPAELAFTTEEITGPIYIDAGVRSGTDNGITAHVNHIPQAYVLGSSITVFGEVEGKPFLAMPTSCELELEFGAEADTWQDPHHERVDATPVLLPAPTGCQHLVHFNPSISVAPDTSFADTPTGLGVEVKLPQGQNPEGLATSGVQNTTVTLPEGVVINPGQAAGLQACQPEQEGLGRELDGEPKEGPPSCEKDSKVGTAEIETPLLKDTLKGNVYVLQSNPPHLQLLIAASGEGVNLKLVGEVHLDEATGRLTTTFKKTPDAPLSDLRLSFSGGAQAALATPTTCGVYTTTSDFTPWSSPFIPDAFPGSSFAIESGTGGAPCPQPPLPFSPSLIAGATTDQAGGFTNFSLLLQRGDDQQRIERLQFKAPPGLSGMLSSVPLCGEPQASAGTCSAASQIGHATVASGPGPYPLVVPEPGRPPAPIFLTGPYKGAPFGLSIVTPVLAGPFNLGTIVTRAKIEVDPTTAQITVTTDPLPQVIDGVPTDLRLIDSVIDRPGFMFNPTNCNPSSFSGTAWGAPPPGTGGPGASAPIESRFQVGSCRSLEFHPKFSVSTAAHTSKAAGASLSVKLAYPSAPQGTQSEISRVKVDLPKQLPSQLKTLQKACLASVFEANPAGCPPEAVVGHAKVITPVLPVPLEGPAYFVSHGGEAFPSLIMVLQGYGVTVDLVGSTFIKNGITSSTFKTVPDTPFNTFELTLPQGKYAALAAYLPEKAHGSFCGQNLKMPTEFVAQNGLVIHQQTPIAVTGCPKVKKLTRAQKLAAALRACKRKPKGKRAACARAARRKYGSTRTRK
jgi:hypothetical protein